MTSNSETIGSSCFPHVPPSLERWFIVHFVVDYLIAIPLLIIPRNLLTALGWNSIDPFATRVVAGALIGIGGISLIARHEMVDTYIVLLKLKILWSLASIVGFIISIISSLNDYPTSIWIFISIFLFFLGLWVYWLNFLKNYTE